MADYIVLKNGKPIFNSITSCDSLENGVDEKTRALISDAMRVFRN